MKNPKAEQVKPPTDQPRGEPSGSTPKSNFCLLNRRGAELLLRLFLGGLFIYSGASKLLDPATFQVDIANFELIPWSLTGVIAVYLPWLEVICGMALMTRRMLGGALAILGLLMVAFILFVISAWARGLDVTCGCFGASDSAPNYPLWILRNLLILSGLIAIGWLGCQAGKISCPLTKGRD